MSAVASRLETFFVVSTLLTAAMGGINLLVTMIASAAPPPKTDFGTEIARHEGAMLDDGKKIFRYETFGSEAFWGDALQLHKGHRRREERRGRSRRLTENRAVRWPQG